MVFGLTFTAVELAVVATATGSAAVGLYVAGQAIRGLRRHEEPSMRYLSVGLILLTGVTYTTALVGTLLLRLGYLPYPYQDWFRLMVRILQLLGLVFIAYALHRR